MSDDPQNAIRLDDAVEAAKRLMTAINDGHLQLQNWVQNDIIQMAVVLFRIVGIPVVDKTDS